MIYFHFICTIANHKDFRKNVLRMFTGKIVTELNFIISKVKLG